LPANGSGLVPATGPPYRAPMNKSQLVDALAERLGDRRTAATAVDAVLQIVVDTVRAGDSVSLAGFGVFESRARAARTGRNPRTGEAVGVPATTVPAFRPGTGFRNAVAGHDAAPGAGRGALGAAATNGSGGTAAVTAVNGSADLEAPATATLLADPPAPTGKGKKSGKKAPAKDVKDKDAKDKGKKGKKGKK
jgi:DNA-binding protein HU-beta